MTNGEKLLKIAEKLKEKEAAKEGIRAKYKSKEKAKKLTTDERLARIEGMLGLGS